jgi:hypothetical protein
MSAAAAMVQEAPLQIYARGVVSYFYFSRAPHVRALKIRQINSAILKVPDGALIRYRHGFLPRNSSHGTSDV